MYIQRGLGRQWVYSVLLCIKCDIDIPYIKRGDNRNWTPRRVPFMSVLLHPTIPLTHSVWSLRSHETCFSACKNTFCKY